MRYGAARRWEASGGLQEGKRGGRLREVMNWATSRMAEVRALCFSPRVSSSTSSSLSAE